MKFKILIILILMPLLGYSLDKCEEFKQKSSQIYQDFLCGTSDNSFDNFLKKSFYQVEGNNVKVEMIVMSRFLCPNCISLCPVVQKSLSKYGDFIKFTHIADFYEGHNSELTSRFIRNSWYKIKDKRMYKANLKKIYGNLDPNKINIKNYRKIDKLFSKKKLPTREKNKYKKRVTFDMYSGINPKRYCDHVRPATPAIYIKSYENNKYIKVNTDIFKRNGKFNEDYFECFIKEIIDNNRNGDNKKEYRKNLKQIHNIKDLAHIYYNAGIFYEQTKGNNKQALINYREACLLENYVACIAERRVQGKLLYLKEKRTNKKTKTSYDFFKGDKFLFIDIHLSSTMYFNNYDYIDLTDKGENINFNLLVGAGIDLFTWKTNYLKMNLFKVDFSLGFNYYLLWDISILNTDIILNRTMSINFYFIDYLLYKLINKNLKIGDVYILGVGGSYQRIFNDTHSIFTYLGVTFKYWVTPQIEFTSSLYWGGKNSEESSLSSTSNDIENGWMLFFNIRWHLFDRL